MWSGSYRSWSEAIQNTTESNETLVIEQIKSDLLKVKNGEAAYERDGVLYTEHNYSWGVLAGLQKAAIENDNKLCVIDFGGSLGRCFYQNIPFLKNLKNVEWCVVEQKKVVECGKEFFQNEQLKFYGSIEEALQYHQPNVLLLSGVINYLEYATKWMDQFNALKIPYVLVDRTSFIDDTKDNITVQKSNDENSSYPCWFFNETKFVKRFTNYSKLGWFPVDDLPNLILDNSQNVSWKGFVFELAK